MCVCPHMLMRTSMHSNTSLRICMHLEHSFVLCSLLRAASRCPTGFPWMDVYERRHEYAPQRRHSVQAPCSSSQEFSSGPYPFYLIKYSSWLFLLTQSRMIPETWCKFLWITRQLVYRCSHSFLQQLIIVVEVLFECLVDPFWLPIGLWLGMQKTRTIQSSVLHKSFQNCEVNLTPRSETIFDGTPWSLMIYLTKTRAVFMAEGVLLSGRKWAIWDNCSTTTKIAMHPSDGGRSTMKSIDPRDVWEGIWLQFTNMVLLPHNGDPTFLRKGV